MRLVATFSILFLLTGNAVAIAETSPHKHGKHVMTPAMRKQHKTMSDIGRHWADAKRHLSNGNLDQMRTATEAMLKAANNVPEFKLHRNADKQEEFQKECNLFKNDLERLKEAIDKRDVDLMKSVSKSVDEACNRCHSRFR